VGLEPVGPGLRRRPPEDGGVLRIGTDDAANHARFLEGKLAQQGT
jgi:hypothetical protein